MDKKITGVMVYYYAVCKRKLWYFYHNISMEQNSDNVAIGKLIDESSYNRDDKHINIDNVINIDFIRTKNILHEVKKSRKVEEASILQVKYYLWYLKQKGVDIKAKIDYPLLKKTIDVNLTLEDELNIKNTILEIEDIVNNPNPPQFHSLKICKNCAYYDLCYI